MATAKIHAVVNSTVPWTALGWTREAIQICTNCSRSNPEPTKDTALPAVAAAGAPTAAAAAATAVAASAPAAVCAAASAAVAAAAAATTSRPPRAAAAAGGSARPRLLGRDEHDPVGPDALAAGQLVNEC